MASLDSWTPGEHRSASGDTRPTYRKGAGRGVVLIHELPGITPDVVAFGDEVVAAETGRTAPVTDWLRSLARELHGEVGGPGVGALGMCFTGGYALAMMVDDAVAAPVVAQPVALFPVGRRRSADLGLSPADQDAVVARARAGCPVLGIRYVEDKAIGTRFETLRRLLGDRFLAVTLPGKGHATLTEHRHQEAVDRVLAFFDERLRG